RIKKERPPNFFEIPPWRRLRTGVTLRINNQTVAGDCGETSQRSRYAERSLAKLRDGKDEWPATCPRSSWNISVKANTCLPQIRKTKMADRARPIIVG